MDTFFSSYSFPPCPAEVHPHDHFQSLKSTRGWSEDSRALRRATAGFQTALLEEFAKRFGKEPNPSLESWQKLCRELGKEEGESITRCKKTVKRTHVNIVDLMAGHVKVFANREEMEEYTRATGRYFSRKKAKDCGGGLLRCLLREMPPVVEKVQVVEEGSPVKGMAEVVDMVENIQLEDGERE